jgi:hypothetical protein
MRIWSSKIEHKKKLFLKINNCFIKISIFETLGQHILRQRGDVMLGEVLKDIGLDID